MRVFGADNSLYWGNKVIPWPVEAICLLAGYGSLFGFVASGLTLLAIPLKSYPLATAGMLVIGYFSIGLWARYGWPVPKK